MPQTKSRTASKSGQGSGRGSSPRSSATGSPKGRVSTKGRASSSTASKASKNGNAKASNGNGKTSGFDVASVARKAKTPLIASGAALAGAAGGLVLGSRSGRGEKIMGALRPHKPRMQMNSHDLAEAAKSIGQFGAQMGELATELRRTREEASSEKRRSPIEVVLEGLTARSSKR